jgi:hypothetical protein
MAKRGIHRGPQAKTGGTKVKGGQALPVTIYPREKTKALIVAAANKAGQSFSNFVLLTVLGAIASEKNKSLTQLLPNEEYVALVERKYSWGKK